MANQEPALSDGRTITWMPDRTLGISAQANGTATQDFWPAGWAAAATFWAELELTDRRTP